jgi:perosamine synthetase
MAFLSYNDLMTDWKIPLYKVYTDDEDIGIITKIIKRGTFWALGPEILEFENALKNYVNADYCATLNSGTSSLHATLLSYGIGKNDEVLIPSFSFVSTANSVLFVDSTPKFVDIEEETFGLDPTKISENISSKTKAIIPMDYGGQSCKILEIQEQAKNHDLILIEDAAESLGSSVNNKKLGEISDATIFSFCGNKVLTTGEGGAVVTNSKEVIEKIKLLRSHGRIDPTNYFSNPEESSYIGLGYNWRMSSITAALGISQLQKLDKIIQLRQTHANDLMKHLKKIPEICLPIPPQGNNHIYQMFTIRLPTKDIRDKLHLHLTNKQIFSKVYFNPIHKTQFYKTKFNTETLSLPITQQVSDQVLTLPLYPNMESEEKNYLLSSIFEFFEN